MAIYRTITHFQGQKNSYFPLALICDPFLSATAFLFQHFWLSSEFEEWPGGLQHLQTPQQPSYWDAIPRGMFFSFKIQYDSFYLNLVCSLKITLQDRLTCYLSFDVAWKQILRNK